MTRTADGAKVASQYLGVAMTAEEVEATLSHGVTTDAASGPGDEDFAADDLVGSYGLASPAVLFQLQANVLARVSGGRYFVAFDPMRAYGWGRLMFGGRGFAILAISRGVPAPAAESQPLGGLPAGPGLAHRDRWLAVRLTLRSSLGDDDKETLTDERAGVSGEEVAVAGETLVRFGTFGGRSTATWRSIPSPVGGSQSFLLPIAAVTTSGALLFRNEGAASRFLGEARREPVARHMTTRHRAEELVLAPIHAAAGEARQRLVTDAGAEAFGLMPQQERVEHLDALIADWTQNPQEKAIVRLLMALSGPDEPQATLERLRTQDAQTYEALFQNLGPELWDLAVAVGRRRAGAAPPTLTTEQVIGLVEQLILSGIPEAGLPVGPSALVDPMRRGVVERPGELPVILPSVLDEIWTAGETAWEALLSAAQGILGNPFEMVAGVIQLVQLAWTVAIANGTVPVSDATRAAAIEEVLQIIVALGPAARSVAAGLAGLEFLGATPQLTLRLRCRAMWEIILAVVTPEKAAAGVAQAAEEAASLARLVRALAVP